MADSGDSNRDGPSPTIQQQNDKESIIDDGDKASNGDKASHGEDLSPALQDKNKDVTENIADTENQERSHFNASTENHDEPGDATADAVTPETETSPSARNKSGAAEANREMSPHKDEEAGSRTDTMQENNEVGDIKEGATKVIREMSQHTDDEENSPSTVITEDRKEEMQEDNELPDRKEVIREMSQHTDDEEDVTTEDRKEEMQEDNELPDRKKEIYGQILVALAVICVVFAVVYQLPYATPPEEKKPDAVDMFNEGMRKVKSSFTNQHPELWRRSGIHVSRHLKTVNPTEPVSLILTSGPGAERTLGCLAQRLAGSFSTALNSSVLNIYGKSKASQDSDQVKLDIDRDLRNAFGGEKLAAVIHRIEELPPGSTLIFYRYCDHENAAYKNVFLVFTVMLEAEEEVLSNATLARVEDMVLEQLKRKFVSSDKSAVFNQMDLDKLSGLWSRISHLILPVAAEEKIEQQGCGLESESF